MIQLQDRKPACFGQWEPSAKECAGGLDPAYTHPITGEKKRDLCKFYEACGSRSEASKLDSSWSPRLIPPSSLYRPKEASTTLHTPPRTVAPAPPAPSYRPFGWSPPPAGTTRTSDPAQSVRIPVEYSMHVQPFLSVPEVQDADDSYGSYALRVLLRSLGKGAALGIAHFFDSVTLRRK